MRVACESLASGHMWTDKLRVSNTVRVLTRLLGCRCQSIHGSSGSHGLAFSGINGVVVVTVVVGIKELLEPLTELEVVLESPFYQFLNGDCLQGGGREGRTEEGRGEWREGGREGGRERKEGE